MIIYLKKIYKSINLNKVRQIKKMKRSNQINKINKKQNHQKIKKIKQLPHSKRIIKKRIQIMIKME